MLMNYVDYAIEMRRKLHQIPEMGWEEFRTTALIIETLDALPFHLYTGTEQIGLQAVMGRKAPLVRQSIERARASGVSPATLSRMEGYTGCIAEFETHRAGPVTALRFDIDCVGVQETDDAHHQPNVLGYASTHSGLMHACAHDGHTAVGLALAHWIADHADSLTGRIKLIFQPAEEGVRGAAAQAASGLLDDVDYLLGAHLGLMCPTGEVSVLPTGVLSTTKLEVRFMGVASHPSMSPQLGRNALACACSCVTSLLGMARHGQGMGCINVDRIEAGDSRNIIPVNARLELQVRGETDEINAFMLEQAKRIIQGSALSYGVDYDIEVVGEARQLTNDPKLAALVAKCARAESSCKRVVEQKKVGCSEDFTNLAHRVQQHGGKTEFFVVGADRSAAHHQRHFDFDEKGLQTAFGIFQRALVALNGK